MYFRAKFSGRSRIPYQGLPKPENLNTPIYNSIGKGYNDTRKADPYISGRIAAHLQPVDGSVYLDIGCGTGNYLQYLTEHGVSLWGIDPSETMLDTAKQKCPGSTLVKGYAEKIPATDDFFSGAMAIFTFHHWTSKQRALSELYRVLKPGSRLVFLSFTPEQMDGYWLAHYFPGMIARSGALIPGEGIMKAMLHEAGFAAVDTEKYFVHEGLQDHFLYSNKFAPAQYLNPEIRKGISSFAAFCDDSELHHGLAMLQQDIASGNIDSVTKSYINDKADYIFYIATK